MSAKKRLTRAERKQIEAAIARANRTDKKEKSAQDSIPYKRMMPDGICVVTDTYFTKTIQFQDINYQLSQNEDKTAIFEAWCDFLNFFDASVKFQLTFANLSVSKEVFTQSISIPPKGDEFDSIREEYAQMLQRQLERGNNGLVKTKYLTFGIEAQTYRMAKMRLERLEIDILNNFKRLGVKAAVLNGKERLQVLHDILRMDEQEPFLFDWNWLAPSGLSTKDFIAPSSFEYKNGKRSSPVPMEIKPIAKDLDGYLNLETQRITLQEGMSQIQTISAGVHEIAHAKLHNHLPKAEDEKADSNTEEVQAESISYAVCQYFGIETGDNSFGYIASWSQGKELEELKASLTIINKTASELITSIEQHFQEICKERGISIEPAEQAQEAAPEVVPEVDEVTFFAKELADYLVEGSKGRKLPEVPFTDAEGITGWVEEHLRNHDLRPLSDAMLDVVVISGQDSRFDDLSDRLAKMNRDGIPQKEAVPAPSKKPDYRLISNFKNMGNGESTYVQKFLPSTDSRMIPAEIVYLGTYNKCLEIQEKLKSGAMTEQQAKALDDSEKMYIIEDKTYLHIQRTEEGFDYTLYDKDTSKLLDGGQIDTPEQHIYSICLTICDNYGLDGYKVSYAPLELAESLREAQYKPSQEELHDRLADHFAQQDAAPEQEIAVPQPDPYVTQQDLVSFGYTVPDMLPISTDFALELMERDVPVYMLNADNTEEMAFDSEDLAMHVGMFGVTTQDWNEVREQPDIVAIQRRFAVSYDRELVAKKEPPLVNHLKNAEMSMEDDYGMIDGIINNGKAPGKEDSKDKKPSVVEKLKNSQPPAHKKSKPKKSQEKEL